MGESGLFGSKRYRDGAPDKIPKCKGGGQGHNNPPMPDHM